MIRSIRQRQNTNTLLELDKLYRGIVDIDHIEQLQLERLNSIWPEISKNSPYYASLKSRHRIPNKFASWKEFAETIPVIDRREFKANLHSIPLVSQKTEYWRITGGTTAEPIQIPALRTEDRITAPNTWFARSWFGANATDRLFLLWGHSHLLGAGVKGKVNAVKRRLKDACFGYTRFSAYDLSEKRLQQAGERILRLRPGYILGYTTALHRLAAFNEDRQSDFRKLGLKVAIATGESFPSTDSETLISRVLGCPVAMEYGAVETGTIAHQLPAGGFQVFWGSYYVEGISSPEFPDSYEVVVTALYPRLTPLLRYRIGDLVSTDSSLLGIRRTFDRVIGRANDGIIVGKDGFVHSEAFSHVMRDISSIQGFQVVQSASREITINYTADALLSPRITQTIHKRLRKIDERLTAVGLNRVDEIKATAAGKYKRVVNHISTRVHDTP